MKKNCKQIWKNMQKNAKKWKMQKIFNFGYIATQVLDLDVV